jgi:tRNA A37 N6-isopentenylltransferase MiaA
MPNPNIATPVTTIEQIQGSTQYTELKTVSPHTLEINERGQKTKVEKMDQISPDTKDTITTHTQQNKYTELQYEQIQDIVRQTILELTPALLETVRSTIHEAVQNEVRQAIRKHQPTDHNL